MKMGAMNNTISLGKPITAPCLIPVEHKATPNCFNQPFMINGECYKVTANILGISTWRCICRRRDSIDVHMLGSLPWFTSAFSQKKKKKRSQHSFHSDT